MISAALLECTTGERARSTRTGGVGWIGSQKDGPLLTDPAMVANCRTSEIPLANSGVTQSPSGWRRWPLPARAPASEDLPEQDTRRLGQHMQSTHFQHFHPAAVPGCSASAPQHLSSKRTAQHFQYLTTYSYKAELPEAYPGCPDFWTGC